MDAVRRRLVILLVSALFSAPCAIVGQAGAAEVTSPERATRFIDDLGSRAITVLADPVATQSDKQDKVRALLTEGLDLATIGRFALGRAWQAATEPQRGEYTALFREYVLNSYARRLTAYSGETFKIVGAQPIADTDALVMSVIERPNGAPVEAGWRVRAEEQGYKVVDVAIEGVSLALTQRQEFAAVIQSKGFDGLLDSLRTLNQQFAGNALATGKAAAE